MENTYRLTLIFFVLNKQDVLNALITDHLNFWAHFLERNTCISIVSYLFIARDMSKNDVENSLIIIVRKFHVHLIICAIYGCSESSCIIEE